MRDDEQADIIFKFRDINNGRPDLKEKTGAQLEVCTTFALISVCEPLLAITFASAYQYIFHISLFFRILSFT